MAQIDATLNAESEVSKSATLGMNRSSNPMGPFSMDANALRAPDYFLFIHSISPKAFEVRMPPIMPKVDIPARRPDERSSKPIKIPNIVNQTWEDVGTGEMRICGTAGERVCMNIINPANMGTDQWIEVDPSFQQFHAGSDLSIYGVFYSRNEVPTDAEIERITKKMEGHYRKLIAKGDELYRSGKQSLISEDCYMAASYFKHRGAWNAVVEIPDSCPLCGGAMRKGSAIHGGAEGCGGVL